MWLLSTDRAELHEFSSPESIPGPYAILSHVWDKDEQTFQDIRKIGDKHAARNPRDYISAKIHRCCVLAERHGYDWLWADSPCIDKSSSAALSEAINSMYHYYSRAEVCYAYLKDVPSGDVFDEPIVKKAFGKSRWHQRGWTLQELIAPRIVVFLSRDWRILGTKAELADLVEEVTRIPARLLRLETQLARFSIAQRMSWAANRQTTREEDRAYSLLGIFGIQMPPLYGEGRQAFYRLQEEIMKRFPDTTLFAWQPVPTSEPSSTLPDPHHPEHSINTYLLAPSPLAFYDSSKIRFSPKAVRSLMYKTTGQSDTEGYSFFVTPHGVLANIPVIELSQCTVAIFSWLNDQGDHLGLRLNPRSNDIDSFHILYDVQPGKERVISLGVDDTGHFTADGQSYLVVWKKLYIAHRPAPDTPTPDAASSLYLPLNLGVLMPFRIPGHSIHTLYTSARLRLVSVSDMTLPWTGSPPITLTFQPDGKDINPAFWSGIDLHLGRCTVREPEQVWSGRHRGLGPHWARLTFHGDLKYTDFLGDPDDSHSCTKDHICDGGQDIKVFPVPRSPLAEYSADSPDAFIELCFTPCPMNPNTTLVVEIIARDGSKWEGAIEDLRASDTATATILEETHVSVSSGESLESVSGSLSLAWIAYTMFRAFGWTMTTSQ